MLERADGDGANDEFERPEVVATISGGVGAGKIRKTEGRTGTPRWVVALICALVFVSLAEPVLFRLLDEDVPLDCAAGKLTLTGPTAFAPVLHEAARSYGRTCPDADFAFDLRGSTEGLRALDDAGQKTEESPGMLAFTDGPKGDDYPRLLPRPVAFSLFTLAINKEAGVNDLTLEQIRQVYDGSVTNWRQLNGHDQPVRLISRTGQVAGRTPSGHDCYGVARNLILVDRVGVGRAEPLAAVSRTHKRRR